MSWGGFSDCVIVMRVGEPSAPSRQPVESAVQLRPKPIQIVAAELVDSDQNDERRRSRGGGRQIPPLRGLRAGAGSAKDQKKQ